MAYYRRGKVKMIAINNKTQQGNHQNYGRSVHFDELKLLVGNGLVASEGATGYASVV